jgi:hypothetical protein
MMKSASMTLDTPNGDLDHGHASGERLRIYRTEEAACSAPHPVAGDLDSAGNPNRSPATTRILVRVLSVIVH